MKYNLYGESVTRDIFRISQKDKLVKKYYARTSFYSQFKSVSCNYEFSQNDIASRIIYDDMNNIFKTMKETLIIDLMCEDLIPYYFNQKVITYSEYFKKMKKLMLNLKNINYLI